MTKITDAEVEAALQSWFKDGSAWNRQMTPEVQQDMRASMRAALEAAEAVRAKAESNLQKVQIPTSTIPEGFIPWHGGECPVARVTVVDAILRGGRNLRWFHRYGDGDIIAYRIHKPADFRLEAGKFYVTASGWREGPMRVHADELFDLSDSDNRLWFADGRSASDPRHDILALSSNQGGS